MLKPIAGALLAVLALTVGARSEAAGERWVASWAMSPRGIPDDESLKQFETPLFKLPLPSLGQGTLRYRLRLSAGGSALRLSFANASEQPLPLAAVSVALAGEGLNAVAGTLRDVRFAGLPAVAVPPHAPALSDPVALSVPDGTDLLVSVHLAADVRMWGGLFGPQENDPGLVAGRNEVRAERFPAYTHLYAPVLVSRVDVQTSRVRRVVVALGDSITVGTVASDGERGWPGALARRLAPRQVAVVNAGIGANRLLEPVGHLQPAALARLDRDVFAIPGVSHIVLLEGINDIGNATPSLTAADLIAAYRQIVAQAHGRGIKIIGGTILPFEGADYYSAEKDGIRRAVNEWMRSAKPFDALIDFDGFMRDPVAPARLRRDIDSGDHLHPSPAGSRAMGEMIPLGLFD